MHQISQFKSAADMADAGIDSAADYHMKAGIKTGRKIIKRENGISKAVDKLTKEEEFNESINPLVPYKKKAVQGLYSYTHFEAPSGAFIQIRHGSTEHYVHQDSKGNQKTFNNIDALKKHVASTKED